MTARRLAREAALWAGGVLGSVCLVGSFAMTLLGVTPLVFQSGSMAPAYGTGALALAREVPAAELAVGDVVSVESAAGDRVTHRVVGVRPADRRAAGGRVRLALRGDANSSPDPETYVVARADRVVLGVPRAGYVVGWASGPVGLVAGAALVAGLLLLAFSPAAPTAGPRRRGAAGGTVAVLTLAALGLGALLGRAPVPTLGAWRDTAAMPTGTVAAAALAPPTPAASPCTAQNTAGSGSITLRWAGVVPGSGVPLTGYDYELRYFDRSTGAQVGSAQTHQHSGDPGAVQSVSHSGSTLGNLLGLDLLSGQSLELRVRSRLKGTQWHAAATVRIPFSTRSTLGLVSFGCD